MRDGEHINFAVVKHATLSGAKPPSKNEGAVMVTLIEVPLQTILTGLLNACRNGAVNLEALHFLK